MRAPPGGLSRTNGKLWQDYSNCYYSGNTWLCVHWQWNTLEWCQLNALQANTQPNVPAFITHAYLKCKKYMKVGNQFCSLYQVDWRNLMKQSVTVGVQLLWGGRYGCNNGRYGCTIVMSYIEINKAVSQWLLTFNLCVSVTWPLTCAFHIPCTHTPEIIDMHRGVCDKCFEHKTQYPLIRAPYNRIVVFWHISKIPPHDWAESN